MPNEPKGPDDDEPVPRLPRTAAFKVSTAALVRIAMTGTLLAMIVVARRPCADSVSGFVTDFDKTGSAGAQMPKPGNVDEPSSVGSAGDYEQLRPDMTEAEIKAAIERAKAKSRAAAGSQAGPGLGSSAGSGQGVGSSAGVGSNAVDAGAGSGSATR
ncbi:MAG: hypothetical protein M4D80_05935 [Myxococcota bacterium]|nr:hypothetical protein [Myxococcota bacterium]